MTSAAMELCTCLGDLTESHYKLRQALISRKTMIAEHEQHLCRIQEHGTEPTPEHVQTRSELYFLEALVNRAESEAAQVQRRVAALKAGI